VLIKLLRLYTGSAVRESLRSLPKLEIGSPMKKLDLVVVVFAALTFASVAAAQSPAFNVATVDCQCSPSSAKVAAYNAALSPLRRKCTESISKVAAEAWASGQDAQKYGLHQNGLSILRLTNTAIPNGIRMSCAGIMAALLILIEK